MPPASLPDSPALENLVREHQDSLLGYLVRWTRDRDLAEDVLQETWLRAWRRLPRLTEDQGSVRSWLLRVAHNLVVDRYRSARARPGEDPMADDTDAPCAATAGLHDRVLDRMVVSQLLAGASPVVRRTITEVYLRDRPLAEVADLLGVPVGTVKSRLHYGLRELRLAAAEPAGTRSTSPRNPSAQKGRDRFADRTRRSPRPCVS